MNLWAPGKAGRKLLGNIYDAFVKRMFGQLYVFIDFLLHYADKRFIKEIDVDGIAPAPTHYIGGEGDERIADLIFLCPLKDGSGTLMAVIVFEHQGDSLICRQGHESSQPPIGWRNGEQCIKTDIRKRGEYHD